MTKLILASLATVALATSFASADRGRSYGRERAEASFRYERGYSRGGDYHRSDSRDRYRHDRGSYSRGYSRGYGGSGLSFSFGFGRSSWDGDRGYIGFSYSRGSGRYDPRSYYVAPPIYVSPPAYVCPAPGYYAPSYYDRGDFCATPYYSRGYSSYSFGGYYRR